MLPDKTTAAMGPLLTLSKGQALFSIDRLLVDPATSTRVLHRTLIRSTVPLACPTRR